MPLTSFVEVATETWVPVICAATRRRIRGHLTMTEEMMRSVFSVEYLLSPLREESMTPRVSKFRPRLSRVDPVGSNCPTTRSVVEELEVVGVVILTSPVLPSCGCPHGVAPSTAGS